jgi:8-oxo-dGTP diphosphatase
LTAAVAREAKEEMGIDVAPKQTKFAHLVHAFFHEDGKEYINVFFSVSSWSGEPQIKEPDKCDEMKWFSLDGLPPNLTPSARMGLQALKTDAP